MTQQNDIPTKVMKENSEVFAGYFQKNKFREHNIENLKIENIKT